MPLSNINRFGQFITKEEWSFMNPNLSSTELINLFECYTGEIVDVYFPTKQVCLKLDDKPYITEKIKADKHRLMREYERRWIETIGLTVLSPNFSNGYFHT